MEPIQLPGSYFGGKGASGVVQKIINQIPKHRIFISGFLGHCAVMRYKKPAEYNFGLDIDQVVIDRWKDAAVPQHIECGKHLYRIAHWKFVEKDFLVWGEVPGIKQRAEKGLLQDEDVFIYLDPPYPRNTRTSRRRYRHEMTERQHIQLLEKVNKMTCMVAISSYPNELYDQALSHWRYIDFTGQTRGGPRTERLYMNYPEPSPDALHDIRFLGDNFRTRERSKRRIETIKSKINRLEPSEKAMLQQWLSASSL